MQIQITVREVRQAAGLSRAELARRTGLKQSHLRKIELGETMANTMTLIRLADALDCSIDELVAWSGDLTDIWL